MKGAFIAIFFVSVSLIGCTNKTKVPKGILSKDNMREVMWDLMQVDVYAQGYIARDTLKNVKKERTILYQQVFNLHKTSRAEFNKSFDYYMGRPDLTQTIFDSLAARAARVTHERAENARLKDSVRLKAHK